jgi:hypothetical protein
MTTYKMIKKEDLRKGIAGTDGLLNPEHRATCDCCGKKIYIVCHMSNGDTLGTECEKDMGHWYDLSHPSSRYTIIDGQVYEKNRNGEYIKSSKATAAQVEYYNKVVKPYIG